MKPDKIFNFIELNFNVKAEFLFIKIRKSLFSKNKKANNYLCCNYENKRYKIRLVNDEIWIINLKCESNFSVILRDNKQIFLRII